MDKERRLKDYNGNQVWKMTFDAGTRNEEVSYFYNSQDGDWSYVKKKYKLNGTNFSAS